MEDGMKVLFHDSFEQGINVPCQELFGRTCKHCENDELRHRDKYAWCVYDQEAKEVKILMEAVNNCSPIPALIGMFETYETLIDRDYVLTKNGSGTTATFSVVPMDKAKFRNDKAKPFSENKMLELLDKAFPDDTSSDDDEEDEKPKKKAKAKKEEAAPKKGKKKPEPEEEDEDEDDADEATTNYEDLSAKELYKLCKDREIKVKPKMDEEYYIEKLEEFDEAHSDEDDEDGEEEW
jgi:hypothetical protein